MMIKVTIPEYIKIIYKKPRSKNIVKQFISSSKTIEGKIYETNKSIF